MAKDLIIQKLLKPGILPLFYDKDFKKCYQTIRACVLAGVHVFEFTNRGTNALDIFKVLVKELKSETPQLSLGIGTIYTRDEAEKFLSAGADFVVQPVCSQDVGALCKERGIVWIPGAFTLQEIYDAHSLGADMVKLFPAAHFGPAFIKAIRGPLPNIKILVTGGVEANADHINKWFIAGADACGLGSQLFNSIVHFEDLTSLLIELISKINNMRNG
ncbi:MAG TPA: bifunctional 4-hydroxy-2-oxoglutarate aldolase/2-dehydro-3-deoxy-phosphogluconate aldolase [Saprospiraceae bacterium]|nr:bifunctional 4-hydroxy-2-oxoglutarate aldolase/2-dehydro-3-deoxy-phosphogluconate aldolase [Saprospiraceae bacterium]